MKLFNFFITLIPALLFFSCTEESQNVELDFSQTDMLGNYANNIIKPSISDYHTSVTALDEKVKAFVSNPTEETYDAAGSALINAYQNWAKVNAFQYGPALENAFLTSSNTFPTNYTALEADITDEKLNLGSVTANNKKGLPAIDYLLFKDEKATVIEAFKANAFRGEYLNAVAADLLAKATYVNDTWSGDYVATFAANEGNDPSSSLSYIVNEYNKAYERCKNQRVGYALGKNSLSGKPSPMSVEAYYSVNSLDLLKRNIISLENYFKGGDGVGLDDYLTAYYNTGSIQEDLSGKILNQFAVIKSKIDNCQSPFANHIEAQDETVEELYTEMSRLVVMIKSEMSSALSVKITYQDSDGD
ncbi:imelysin family protein [Flammeovirga aprica]|uniref:Imelysin family protein n=1 Tax=Flammeovirga aprica JL-4 TaxID=694437 RepID=A0A7X9XCQ1_9BACT|nr:imelysin family protein [Flammeovirga aprica]NME72042.1 imelysin family protein [Flammeovirga aprica JL-4]